MEANFISGIRKVEGASYNAALVLIFRTIAPMKKLLTLLLLCCAAPVLAQHWVRYAESDESVMYFDSLRTRKMGDTAFVWDLHDIKSDATDAPGKHYRSILYAVEYQCRARKWRVLSVSRHAQPMGAGKPVYEEAGAGAFAEATPGSRADQLFVHICE
jgi:hypothetical protein